MIQTKPTEVGASDSPPIKQPLSVTEGKHLSHNFGYRRTIVKRARSVAAITQLIN